MPPVADASTELAFAIITPALTLAVPFAVRANVFAVAVNIGVVNETSGVVPSIVAKAAEELLS